MSVLEFLLPRLKNGMIIAFDDYFCWSATQLSGERRAQLEFFSRHSRWELVPFVQFGWHGSRSLSKTRKSWAPDEAAKGPVIAVAVESDRLGAEVQGHICGRLRARLIG
jgi:hypothetical protein